MDAHPARPGSDGPPGLLGNARSELEGRARLRGTSVGQEDYSIRVTRGNCSRGGTQHVVISPKDLFAEIREGCGTATLPQEMHDGFREGHATLSSSRPKVSRHVRNVSAAPTAPKLTVRWAQTPIARDGPTGAGQKHASGHACVPPAGSAVDSSTTSATRAPVSRWMTRGSRRNMCHSSPPPP